VTAAADGATARGTVRAVLDQPCVATGDPVRTTVDEPFAIRFIPHRDIADEELELSADDLDVMPIDDNAVDLGEAVAQTLALALDPYPRSAGAASAVAAMGAEEAGPFAGLKDLLKRD
jgi:uncharacterized metal-binding protein YceD (DUF177 family)